MILKEFPLRFILDRNKKNPLGYKRIFYFLDPLD
jgi:hypothetical protein